MRHLLIAVAFVAASVRFAAGADETTCRWHRSGEHHTEWLERGESRGARIVSVDSRWILHGLGWHATSSAVCETCPRDQISGAVLWLSPSEPAGRNLSAHITLNAVADVMLPFPFYISGAQFEFKSNLLPISVGGLEGFVRAVEVRLREGGSSQFLVLAVAKDCVSLSGILHPTDGATVAIDSIRSFIDAIRVEWYQPVQKPDPVVPQSSPPLPNCVGPGVLEALRGECGPRRN